MIRRNKDNHGVEIGRSRSLQAPNEVKRLRHLSSGLRRMLQIAHQSRKRNSTAGRATTVNSQNRKQRSVTRLTYMEPKSPGHWYAHGAYIQRETATGKEGGFDQTRNQLDLAKTLQEWQNAGDPRLFKLLLSPENGAHLDMHQYVRDVMTALQKDHSCRLEWVAAVHENTDNPHAHIAIRGVTTKQKELVFSRQYIKEAFRFHAENVATMRLGYRSEDEIQTDLVKQIRQNRVTSLDRQLTKMLDDTKTARVVSLNSSKLLAIQKRDAVKAFAIERRLEYLTSLGLAKRLREKTFEISEDHISTLRMIQAVGDKQRMLARHMEAASSTDLPVVNTEWKDVQFLQGRILGHGELEESGRRYMLLEGVDGVVYHLRHRKDTEELRSQNRLRKNEFVTLKREYGKMMFIEMGHADALLKDQNLLARLPYRSGRSEKRPGWLGRFDKAVLEAQSLSRQPEAPSVAVRLADDQVRLLIESEFSNDREQQKNAIHQLLKSEEPVHILAGKVELNYSVSSRTAFAVLPPGAKQALDSHISRIQAERNAKHQERPTRRPENQVERT